MRMTPTTITFHEHQWEAVMDALWADAAMLEVIGESAAAAKNRAIATVIRERCEDSGKALVPKAF